MSGDSLRRKRLMIGQYCPELSDGLAERPSSRSIAFPLGLRTVDSVPLLSRSLNRMGVKANFSYSLTYTSLINGKFGRRGCDGRRSALPRSLKVFKPHFYAAHVLSGSYGEWLPK